MSWVWFSIRIIGICLVLSAAGISSNQWAYAITYYYYFFFLNGFVQYSAVLRSVAMWEKVVITLWLLPPPLAPTPTPSARNINPFPAQSLALLMLFSFKSSLKGMLKRPEMFMLRAQLRLRMYQRLELRQELAFNIRQQQANCTLCTLPHTSHDVLKAGKGFIVTSWLAEVFRLLAARSPLSWSPVYLLLVMRLKRNDDIISCAWDGYFMIWNMTTAKMMRMMNMVRTMKNRDKKHSSDRPESSFVFCSTH